MKLVLIEKGKDDNLMEDFFPFMEHPELPNLSFALEREPEDRLVLMALEAILNEKLHSVFLPCSFAYRKNKNIRDFYAKVVGWGQVSSLLLFSFSASTIRISQSRLLSKRRKSN